MYSYNAPNSADSRGNNIETPVEVIDCTSDLDIDTSERSASKLAPQLVHINRTRREGRMRRWYCVYSSGGNR